MVQPRYILYVITENDKRRYTGKLSDSEFLDACSLCASAIKAASRNPHIQIRNYFDESPRPEWLKGVPVLVDISPVIIKGSALKEILAIPRQQVVHHNNSNYSPNIHPTANIPVNTSANIRANNNIIHSQEQYDQEYGLDEGPPSELEGLGAQTGYEALNFGVSDNISAYEQDGRMKDDDLEAYRSMYQATQNTHDVPGPM